jgi:hypothetical protein
MTEVRQADIGLVRGTGLAMAAVRWGTFSPYGHAVLAKIDGGLEILQAAPGGANVALAADWPDIYWLTDDPVWAETAARTGRSEADLREAVSDTFVTYTEPPPGRGYNWPDIYCIALLQIHIKPPLVRHRVQSLDTLICSQACDLTCAQNGVQLFDDGRLPMDVTPGDLYRRYLRLKALEGK